MTKTRSIYCAGLLGLTCISAAAVSIDPTYTSFGTLSGATFGGSGIPNNAVAITTLTSGIYDFTLGLTAHQRYSNPAPVNDGAGTFWAVTGNDSAHGKPGYARWNIGYYVDVTPDLSSGLFGGGNGYSVRLFYDNDPAMDNDVTKYVTLEPNYWNGKTFDSQNSWNLGMVVPFSAATGEYSFALAVFKDGTELGRSAINVNVNDSGTMPNPVPAVPDGGATVAMLGAAMIGLGALARRGNVAA